MTPAPNLEYAAALLLGLATAAFFIAGAAFLINSMVVARQAIARRVDHIRGMLHGAPGAKGPNSEGGAEAEKAKAAKKKSRLVTNEVIRRMGRLGVGPENAEAAFFALRMGLVAVFGLGAALLASAPGAGLDRPLMVGVVAGALGWFLPYLLVRTLAARRIQAIEAGLPEALELMVVAVEAGLALEDAINHVVAELQRSRPALAEELDLTSADLKILPSRDIALANLAKRVDVPSVRSLVTTLSQTMRYGTPLVQALRTVATQLRNDALIKLEENANRLPALLTVPMMIFILPAIFLVIGGPVALRLIDLLLS